MTFLKQAYPFYYHWKNALFISVILLCIGVLFDLAFEPFEVNHSELVYSYPLTALIHALVSTAVFLLCVGVLGVLRPLEAQWKVYKELGFLAIVLCLIGIGQFLIRDLIYLKDDNWSMRYFLEEIRNTFLLGSLFVFIITSINVERLQRLYRKRSKNISLSLKKQTQSSNKLLSLKTHIKSDDFDLDITTLVFVMAQQNYVSFHLTNGEVLLKRMTLKSVATQLAPYEFIVKTHRSYIVSLLAVTGVDGNAQGYQLDMKGTSHTVPVSRGMITTFEQQLRQMTI
ncbi:MAG: LytTR family transcriptional regulator DNA-binding domain-containing protein [Dokdonia sp.]|jgi:hypothetical protein|nr:LytR family transcriptional regulator [Cytophagaceae bacterium]